MPSSTLRVEQSINTDELMNRLGLPFRNESLGTRTKSVCATNITVRRGASGNAFPNGIWEREKGTFMGFNGCEFCLPVFFHSYSLHDGHTEETENATLTFIKYKNRIYAVTCKHIIHHLHSKRKELKDQWYTLSLSLDRVILHLSYIDHSDPTKRKDIFRKLKCNLNGEEVDIVIAPINNHWELIKSKKKKRAIDLDNWNEPNWEEFNMGTAFGYPTEHKEKQGDAVAAPCIKASAEIASKLNKNSTQLTLFSTLKQPHGYFFSGLSGGVIILSNKESYETAGIVYEGQPSSSKYFKEKESNEQAFFSANDILIKGFIINPNIFSGWLRDVTCS